jgi:DNA (cytosine-5)-methyltransferase 1
MGRQDSGDERNQLVLEFVRLVEEVRPRTFCMENVPGLLQPQFAPLLATALRRLRAAGYSISGSDVVLRAEDFGVPQKRRRVLIMGTLTADAPDTPVGDRASAPFSVADAFRGLPSPTATLIDGDAAVLSEDQIAGMEAVPGSYLDFGGLRTDSSGPSGRRRLVNAGVLSGYRLTTHRSDISARFLAAQQGMKEPISRFYKLSSDLPALTLRAGTGRERGSFSAARPIHPLEPRVITVREAARLHSFPDWFRFHTTNWHGHRQIGNAVPPLLARAAAKSILKVLGIDAVPAGSPVTAIPDAALLALSPTSAANQLGALLAQVPQDRRGLSGEALTESVPAPRIGIGELSG